MTAPWLLACASVRASLGVLPQEDAAEITNALATLRAWAKGDAGVDLLMCRYRLWTVRNRLQRVMFDVRRDSRAPRGSYASAHRRYLVAQFAFALAQAAIEPDYATESIHDALTLEVMP